MSKQRVAILAGGYSSEWEISMKSAEIVLQNLNPLKFEAYIVEVRREQWTVLVEGQRLALDLNNFGFTRGDVYHPFDVAFNAIHGDPGENGKIQGYLESRGIRHTSSSQAVSALTFTKWECNVILKQLGFTCAKSILIQKGDVINEDALIKALELPFFMKPNQAGSSFGVSKVKQASDIRNAVKKALTEDNEIVAEVYMPGMEVACGVFESNGEIIALTPTEIVSQNEFFDYEAKYQGKSEEITPARIEENLLNSIRTISADVYRRIRAAGIVRVDFILVDKVPHIVEVNSVPGLSGESIIPKQARYAGYSLEDFFGLLIEEALRN